MKPSEDKQEVITYNHLVKRAIKIAIEFIILLIILFYIPVIIMFFRFIYRI